MTFQKRGETPARTFDEKLDLLAEVAVKVGLGLAHDQELVMTAPIEALPLVRRITRQAYKAGASIVTTLFTDEESTLLRFRHAPQSAFDVSTGWLFEGMARAFEKGAARLAIVGENPALLAGEDPDKVARANRARSGAYLPALKYIAGFEINWTIASFATAAWAKSVFPDDPAEIAVARLWHAIFAASRIDTIDPIADWKAHNENLHARASYLNDRSYSALHFRGPGTDLIVGLADDHFWAGGATRAKNGIVCNPNIPSEEVFTTPHRERTSGTVTSTKPLSYQGTLIEQISVRFEGGRIVEARAKTGGEVLNKVLDTDDGARRLGEVALVPHSSPIASGGLLFLNTLFDENAASHIALGQAYAKCIRGGGAMSEEQLAAKGANKSLIHIDWMIGSNAIDVDGIRKDGGAEPLMRKGEWAYG
ncbi:MAG TPA: aminopeptidase [Bauldia sp.]|nr:aminopeptidase [Bauldia sp.]